VCGVRLEMSRVLTLTLTPRSGSIPTISWRTTLGQICVLPRATWQKPLTIWKRLYALRRFNLVSPHLRSRLSVVASYSIARLSPEAAKTGHQEQARQLVLLF